MKKIYESPIVEVLTIEDEEGVIATASLPTTQNGAEGILYWW